MISSKRPQHERLKLLIEPTTTLINQTKADLTKLLSKQISHSTFQKLAKGKFFTPKSEFLTKNDDNISCASTQESTNSEESFKSQQSFFCQTTVSASNRVTGTTITTTTGTKTATERVTRIRIRVPVIKNIEEGNVVVQNSEILNFQAKRSFMKIKKVLEENCDKKLKAVLTNFAAFQNLLLTEKIVKKEKFEILRFENMRALELCLEIFGKLRYQHADAISSSILYFTTGKIGLPKREFLKLVDKVTKKKCGKLSIIRKAKCFGMIKSLLLKKVKV